MRYVKKIAIDAFGYGDLVVTAGLGGIYPKGINIGRVRIIRARDYETSLELEIEPIIDFSRLEYVFVLRAAEETPQSAGESATQKPAASAAPPATPTTQTPATQKPAAAEPQVVKPAAPSPSRGAGLTPSPASDGAAVPSPSEDTVAPSPAAGSPPADSPPVSTPEPEAASPPGPSSESETGENGSPVTDQGAVQ
jgi:hypothetical protein